MLKERFTKVKEWLEGNKGDLTLAMIFFFAVITSFGLGRLSVLVENRRREPIKIESRSYQNVDSKNAPAYKQTVGDKVINNRLMEQGAMLYVGSKNSNKYHLPDCQGALRIKEENKIWFSSKKEAENLGYTPASGCEGL